MTSRDYVLIAAGAATFVLIILVLLPRLVIRRLPPAMASSVPDVKDRLALENDRLKLRNEFRTTCVSFIGGLAVLAGVLIAFQQFQSSQQAVANSVQTSKTQLEIAQQVARNQQYVDNVKNLGDPNATVRVAAVESIYQIGGLGFTQRVQATQILTAHIQQWSPWPPVAGDPYPPEDETVPPLRSRRPDVSLAFVRLGQSVFSDAKDVSLYEVDLRNANIQNGDYSGHYFSEVHMEFSQMDRTNLQGTVFVDSDLDGSDLSGAKLCGAWLNTTDLTGATLRGAKADEKTTWPDGFDHAAAGVTQATGTDCT